ncbi:Disease resistance protein RPM1 [Acorus calamus]|uniref:Disease resistance protein RPM1 n=1 Tax=Acorus calamus TaxID=4465 RepID=A0AAV9EZE7_ACOCL|nr:Disease resistance protein RPM1 [Acorus calamus]
MAESAVNLLMDVLKPIIENEVRLLGGVHSEMRDIVKELESMVSCLREADRRENDDEGVKTWVKQLREAAYDTEDVVEEYLLHLAHHHQGRGRLMKFLLRNFQCALHLRTRHQIAVRVHEIKLQVHDIADRRSRYNFDVVGHHDSSNRYNGPRMASLLIDEAELVGIDVPKEKLVGWLTNDERGRVVISVVAMGGMGKTTLVKKVYDHARVKKPFDYFDFVVVSKTYSKVEIMRNLIKTMHKQRKDQLPPGLDEMSVYDLGQSLKDYLQDKRYVVVFDDVWNLELWEEIKFAFPVNSYGRIIITTREVSVAQSCTLTSGHLYELQPLTDDKSWDLFCRTTFPFDRCCPDELEELSLNIVKRCQGIPLAIVAIGGMLAVKDKTVSEWERVRRGGFGMYDEREHTIVNMKRIILLSYNDLPYNLKSCLLYLSLFPEGCEIKFMKLIRLWMAEGFVKSNQPNIMVEEVAKEYINVLIKRCLILIADRNSYGEVISCRVHVVVREIILSKAREENFTTFVSTDGLQMHNRPRRLSVHGSFDATSQVRGFTHVRSLFMFDGTAFSTSSAHEFFSSFRLLKVLDLDGMPLVVFPNEITELLHLRYLSLRDTSIRELPKSIKRLRNLETLNLKGTMVRELPVEILKLRKLRHLLVYLYDYSISSMVDVKGVRMPMGIGQMLELQKLCFVDVGGRDSKSGQIKELRKLTQLKRLGIIKLRTEDGRDLCDAIQHMEGLLSFGVTSRHENDLLDLCLSQPPKLLERVHLKGMLESLPSWITMLQNPVRLSLLWSKLKDDPFESLQNLPNLAELELGWAYDGNELRCGEGGFKRLKVLHIYNLNELKVVEIGKGAMCGLQELSIAGCQQLEKVPLGIEHIAHLKVLTVWDMSEEFYSRLRKDGGEDRPRIEHIEMIQVFNG